jgi:glycosyltransferase involved in cell wall biosynthesis
MVIVRKFIDACISKGIQCEYITSLEGRFKDDFIIPYSSTPALELIRKGYKTKMAFLVDAYSLGELNKIRFYASKGLFFKYDFFYSIYAYMRAVVEEKKLLKHYENVMLVSQTDINYLKKISGAGAISNYICVPNGASVVKPSTKNPSNKIRLGLLSSWDNRVSYEENDWFVRSYWPKLYKEDPLVELYIAGRGEFAKKYIEIPGVVYIGELDSLDDFFKNVDIFLSVNPKGCGILNRVLDAFSYKTVVLGYHQSFSGFSQMKNAYVSFKDYKSFVSGISYIVKHPSETQTMIKKASSYLDSDFNWASNYDRLVDYIVKLQ